MPEKIKRLGLAMPALVRTYALTHVQADISGEKGEEIEIKLRKASFPFGVVFTMVK